MPRTRKAADAQDSVHVSHKKVRAERSSFRVTCSPQANIFLVVDLLIGVRIEDARQVI
jgi:hypothetical protein